MSHKIKIKSRLNEILQEQGRGINELARATGLTSATLSRIANNHTRAIYFDVMEKLCNELNITPGDLFEVTKVDGKK